jgi:hypothetical protein
MTQIIDNEGLRQEVTLSIDDYKAAFDAGLTLPQYLNNKYPTDSDRYGTAFEQALASNGMFMHADRQSGIRPPTMAQVLNGTVNIGLGPITRPDGNNAQTLSGRLLFPAAILELVESQLMEDNSAYASVFNRLVATTSSVDSPRVDQPIIDLTAPRGSRSMPIAQLSEPAAMVTITLSEKSFRLPTVSIGLEISDEAQRASALDLVGIALREQALGERAAIIDESITKLVSGDTDLGMSALSSVKAAVAYDTGISSAGVITNKAWVKYLRQDWKKLNIDWVICDLDTYLAIEGRTGRPVVADNDGTGRLTSLLSLANPGIPDMVNFFVVDTAILGANTLVGIDSSRAIRKVVYAGASYSAIENYVMRKSSGLRIDFSEGYFRLIDGAWKKMTLTL